MRVTTIVLAVASAWSTACTTMPSGTPAGSALAPAQMAAPAYSEEVVTSLSTPVTKHTVICRHEARVGSRIKREVCRTVAEIDSEREQGQALVRALRRGMNVSSLVSSPLH